MLQLEECKNKLTNFKHQSGLKYGLIRIGIFRNIIISPFRFHLSEDSSYYLNTPFGDYLQMTYVYFKRKNTKRA